MRKPTNENNTLLPWVGALCAITLIASIACGGTTEENNGTTEDMGGGVVEDQGGGGGGGEDQGGGGGGEDQGGGGGGGEDQGGTDPIDQGGTEPEDMGNEPEDMETQPTTKWSVYAHPCAGNRTDALHCDDDLTCYTGCGTTVPGRGIFKTTDGGKTWDTLETDPEDFLNGSRVNDIWRSPDDGKLYVAGEHGNGYGVVSVDSDGTIGEVFKRGNKVGFGFTPGSFRRGASGKAIVESLTGVDLLYREMDSSEPLESWMEGTVTASTGSSRVQILDLDVVGDDFYGCGSRIIEAPRVFLPAWDEEFAMEPLELSEPGTLGAYAGELWGIDADESGVVAGGVNQGADVGMIYVFNHVDGLAPNDRDNWIEYKVSKTFDGKATWVQGVCRDGDTIYAVGRESREGWGFVLRSQDAGESWEDISPYEAGASKSSFKDMYRCQVTSTGGVIVAGSGGQFAIYED